MNADSAPEPARDHPLLADRPRLEKITDVMYAQIQKVMHVAPQDRGDVAAGRGVERTLVGGTSADDILQEALLGLLRYPPAKLNTSWEALGVRIAQNKAKEALRKATKGRRRGTDGEDDEVEIDVVSLNSPIQQDEGSIGEEIAHTLEAGSDPEADFIRTEQQLILVRLARELLSERDRRIFFDVHFLAISNAEVGRQLGLTGARVGQVYTAAAERVLNAAHNHRDFRRISDFTEGGENG